MWFVLRGTYDRLLAEKHLVEAELRNRDADIKLLSFEKDQTKRELTEAQRALEVECKAREAEECAHKSTAFSLKQVEALRDELLLRLKVAREHAEILKAEKKGDEIIVTSEFQACFDAMREGSDPVFISGPAGTGKSTLIRVFLSCYAKSATGTVLLAPTGVAAELIGGQTIHSFFKFKPERLTPTRSHSGLTGTDPRAHLIKKLDILILDEVSMVAPEMIDAIDYALREGRGCDAPFGGCKVVLIGDLGQLPPVIMKKDEPFYEKYYGKKSPYFFDAQVFQHTQLRRLKLTQIFRQTERTFVETLLRLRKGVPTGTDIEQLNERHFSANLNKPESERTSFFPKNIAAKEANDRCLAAIPNKLERIPWIETGEVTLEQKKDSRFEEVLELKVGARIMMLVNAGELYRNGTVGIVKAIDLENGLIEVKLPKGDFAIERHGVSFIEKEVNKETDDVEEVVKGTLRQFPMKLAWGITIHKSQGMSLDEVYVDTKSVFASGQTYVALSRVRSLQGLNLLSPVNPQQVMIDQRLLEWM